MNTRSKTTFLQGHYNIVAVVNNNPVMFIRFSHFVYCVYFRKGLDSSTKVKARHQTLIF